MFVLPNDKDKYSDRDNEKNESGKDPVIQGQHGLKSAVRIAVR